MGNFEKLSVLVIVVIIVMILVVALYTWTGDPSGSDTAVANVNNEKASDINKPVIFPTPPIRVPAPPKPGLENLTPAQILEKMRRDALAGGGMDGGIGIDPLPTPPPVPQPPVVKEPRYHIVASGETVAKVAKIEYPGVSQPRAIDGILKANPTVDPSRMAINTKLLLPDLGDGKALEVKSVDGGKKPASPESIAASIKPGSVYVTKKGDTLPSLAKRAYRDGNHWYRIWVENFDDITDQDHLQPGLRLRIPVL